MGEINYQHAIQVLKARIGVRLDGTETNGRHEIVRVLKSELGIDNRQANEMLDAMIHAGTIRYHYQTDPNDRARSVPEMAGPGSSGQAGAPTIAGFAGASPNVVAGIGYWQIGHETDEEIGRKGQIHPT